MLFDRELFIGIDPAGGRNGFVWTALNRRLEPVALRDGSLDDLIAFVLGIPNVFVAINSARGTSLGLMNDPAFRAGLQPEPRPERYTHYRVCDYLLAARNIRVTPAPAEMERASRGMKLAFELYRKLAAVPSIQVIEYHAHAAYCGILGRIPFGRNTLEGRIQRQLALADVEIHLKDAMEFFEEITRRRLLAGVLPEGILYSARQLDGLIGAYTAWKHYQLPDDTLEIGDELEGRIVLPVGQLKEKYS